MPTIDLNLHLFALDFWRKVTVFNSVLNDGHMAINFPKPKKLANKHVKNGGGLFPFQVVFDQDKLIIKSKFDGKTTEYRGSEITHINDQKTSDFILPLFPPVASPTSWPN